MFVFAVGYFAESASKQTIIFGIMTGNWFALDKRDLAVSRFKSGKSCETFFAFVRISLIRMEPYLFKMLVDAPEYR